MSVDNIMTVYNMATPAEIKAGIVWYAEAQKAAQQISVDNDLPLHIVVGVVAALSPNNKWDRNVTNARDLIEAFLAGESVESVKVSTYNTMKLKAWSILVDMLDPCEITSRLNGQKIVAFYRCIMGEDACCVDGHARNIYYGERVGLTDAKTNIGKKEYGIISDAYVAAAAKLSKRGRYLSAYEVQAITWTAWRRIHGIA